MGQGNRPQTGEPRYVRGMLGVQAGRSLWSGFIMGLGAITMLGAPTFNPPKYGGDGIRGDWRAIGNDIRGALRRGP